MASKSWTGIPWWRRLGYYARYALAVFGALLAGPGTAISPMDPRRLRDAPPGPDSVVKKQLGSDGSAV